MLSVGADSRQLLLGYAVICVVSLGQLQMVQAACGCASSASGSQSSPMGPASSSSSSSSAAADSSSSSLPASGTKLLGSGAVRLIEGDILLSPEQQRRQSSDTQQGNNSLLQWTSSTLSSIYWPNGNLYYSLSSEFTSSEANFIASSLLELQQAVRNAVTFKRVTAGQVRDYVSVISGVGCYSYVGRQTGMQVMSLQRSICLKKYIVQHEFLHALGYWHEQSRSDRDRFVTIWWSFIDSEMCNNFGIYGSTPSDYPTYDANSIMHYDSFAFSCNGSTATITSKTTGIIPYPIKLTDADLLKIHYYYGAGDNSTRYSTLAAQRNPHSQGWLVIAGSIVTGVLIVIKTELV